MISRIRTIKDQIREDHDYESIKTIVNNVTGKNIYEVYDVTVKGLPDEFVVDSYQRYCIVNEMPINGIKYFFIRNPFVKEKYDSYFLELNSDTFRTVTEGYANAFMDKYHNIYDTRPLKEEILKAGLFDLNLKPIYIIDQDPEKEKEFRDYIRDVLLEKYEFRYHIVMVANEKNIHQICRKMYYCGFNDEGLLDIINYENHMKRSNSFTTEDEAKEAIEKSKAIAKQLATDISDMKKTVNDISNSMIIEELTYGYFTGDMEFIPDATDKELYYRYSLSIKKELFKKKLV